MKHVTKLFSILLLLSWMSLLLTACGSRQLSGTYEAENAEITMTFDGDTLMVNSFGDEETATYEIRGNKIYITTYNSINDAAREPQVSSFHSKGDTILIDDISFTRVGTAQEKSSSRLSISKLRGVYRQVNGTGVLAIGEDLMVQRTNYGIFKGSYDLSGNQLTFNYTSGLGNEEGWVDGISYTVSLDGDRLTLTAYEEDTVYVRQAGSGGGNVAGAIMKVVGIALGVLILLALLVFLRNKLRQAERTPHEAIQGARKRAAKASHSTVAAAKDIGLRAASAARSASSAVATGVSAGIAAGKDAHRAQKKIDITSDSCCICGRQLQDGGVPLGGLPSGRKAWIDRSCLIKLQTMAQGKSYEDFLQVARYMQGQAAVVEPEVAQALGRYVRKCAARFQAK